MTIKEAEREAHCDCGWTFAAGAGQTLAAVVAAAQTHLASHRSGLASTRARTGGLKGPSARAGGIADLRGRSGRCRR